MTDREAMKLALEALKTADKKIIAGGISSDARLQMKSAITALRQALEQPEQEFVSWGYRDKRGKIRLLEPYEARMDMFPLYTAPPKREWVGLNVVEIGRLTVFDGLHHVDTLVLADFIRAIEAKLKEKNK